jgi:superfamily II DNA or RNA helicase
MRVADLLAEVLADGRARTTREAVAAIRAAGGHGVSRTLVERTLTGDGRFDPGSDPARPRWTLRDGDPGADGTSGREGGEPDRSDVEVAGGGGGGRQRASDTRAQLDALDLRDWQAEALSAWSQTGRGVVEAVTGTGKTRLAMAAIRAVADRGAKALVLVPTLDLLDQWARELRAAIPDLTVGRLGGGRDDDLFANDVVVATPHSAAAVPVDLPPGTPGLLIADEAHRYGAPTWGAALHEVFTFRLALTATYERGDEGIVDVLEPYFGDVVFRYGYDRAVSEGTVSPFRIALVGVELTDREREAYDAADLRVKQLHRELVGGLGMPRDPKELFAAVAAVVGDADRTGSDGPQARACREYLVRVRERRDVAATASAKLEVCRVVGPGLAGGRSLVFTDTVDQADDAARVLTSTGPSAETVHGQLTAERRRIRLALFRRGDLEVVVAPRVLDEGVDVPAADVAVVLAAFRTRRQMVQRLGRVLRVKPDGRHARLVIAYAVGTAEDPSVGGHRDFLADVRSVAASVDRFVLPLQADEVVAWLSR